MKKSSLFPNPLLLFLLFSAAFTVAQINSSTPYTTLFSYDGQADILIAGASELHETGGSNNCGTDAPTQVEISLPTGVTGNRIIRAYVHWYTMTRNRFNGLPAYKEMGNLKFTPPGSEMFSLSSTSYPAYLHISGKENDVNWEMKRADVTQILRSLKTPNGVYMADIIGGYVNSCPKTQANIRAWTLTIVYDDPTSINYRRQIIFDGFTPAWHNNISINIAGYEVPMIGDNQGEFTAVFVQGDPGITGEVCTTSDQSFPNFGTDFGNGSEGGGLDIDKVTGNLTRGSNSMTLDATSYQDAIIPGVFAMNLASTQMALPVELTLFEGSYDKSRCAVDLSWQTTAEINNEKFFVERSIDGENWELIGAINGAVNSQSENNYSYKDQNPEMGSNFYRLTQQDLDGKTRKAGLLKVERPNVKFNWIPSVNSMEISANVRIIECLVVNMNGQSMPVKIEEPSSINSKQEKIIVKMDDFPTGVYLIKTNIGSTKVQVN